mmetsp:Transcript_17152/g.32340  ORF Transcript_17152/g.32340 Transcript_17152/m.32340 type:complete len:180 (+) Transcript_17152:51-590(+)
MSESGVVKFFNSVDSYGFIRRRSGPDVYVHRSAIADGQHLLRGDKVCFDVVEEEGAKIAARVTGGTGGTGLTVASKVDRSARKNLYGTVKKSFATKNYGFIKQKEGGSDMFFHKDALAEEGELPEVGSYVRYDNVWDDKKAARKATNVVVVDEIPEDQASPCVATPDGAASDDEWELVA